METLQEETPPTRRSRREAAVSPPETPKKKPRRRVSIFGVIGELFITVGVVVLLYVAWQMWVGDWIGATEKNQAGAALSEQWQQEAASLPDPPIAEPADAPVEIPVMAQPADGEIFAVMRIPRFGADYQVPIAGGVTRERTLDDIGIGHYPDTAMPGEVGNFAVAGHRVTYGKPFNRMADLRIGDAIVVETPAGWYTYRFRSMEYVKPTRIEVLAPIPQHPDLPATTERYISMTACSPMWSLAERIQGYGVMESFTPIADGPPASLTEELI